MAVATIASETELFANGLRLTEPAQHIRSATALGLVARDATGEVVPALADRWIVTDEGRSYIFRLRSGTWPDGSELTAQTARTALRQALRGLRGTAMEQDLAPIVEVRAMAGRVIELRLSGPFPTLLQLLAQPELALAPMQDTGDMRLARTGHAAVLSLKPPDARGLPEDPAWREKTRVVQIIPLSATDALAAFDRGEAEVVLGGRLATLPLVDIGPLSRGTIQVDPAIGLFGLRVQRATGPLEDEELREGLSMAIDRVELLAGFGIGGWNPTSRLVNQGLADDPGQVGERWAGRTIEDRRSEAARRVAAWRARQPGLAPGPIALTLEIGEGPGLARLFDNLAAQLAPIGIRLERSGSGKRGDLALVDDVARYAAPLWFLNQFHCSLRRGPCDEEADKLAALAIREPDLAARANWLAQAEAELTTANVYIPLATPLRWSLVRGEVNGFAANGWAFHPLPALAQIAR